uniref:Short-chain dehydrogenase n=1 Tax=Hirondellea gigas TaxID=1518452 RepID=A0A6A7FZU1_9CRUS
MFSLDGRVAVITGGSRGLGREMSFAFARAGAHVVVTSRKIDTCEAVAKEIQAECPGIRAVPFACHVGKWDKCNALVDFVYSEFGRCDILVNNAGGSPLYPSLSDISEEYFDKIMALNLKGPFRLMAAFGAKMCAQSGGSIINISSTETVNPNSRATIYGAAKIGLNYLTEAFSSAYGPKVRVNCIMCGPFLTDISKAWPMKEMEIEWKRSSSLMRAGKPNEVVGAALYFASDASSFCTGSILRLDGGAGRATYRDPKFNAKL